MEEKIDHSGLRDLVGTSSWGLWEAKDSMKTQGLRGQREEAGEVVGEKGHKGGM